MNHTIEKKNNKGLELQDISIQQGATQLINLAVTVQPGEITTIMGPSGSGKSTFLSYISGFLDSAFKASGSVLLNGRDITLLAPHYRRVGVLFQDAYLFPHLSVAGNLLFALPANVKGREKRQKLVDKALYDLGLDGFNDRDPATLSGGQKARVALMRVLLSQPEALLLDEPFSKLDVDRRDQVRRFIFDAARTQNLPTLLVTHDHSDAEAAGGVMIDLEHMNSL